jgi:opacity protein-like surface antigen
MIARSLRGLLAATVLVAAVSTAAEAQMHSQRFAINAGVALPMGDFGDAAETGFHGGIQFSMPLSGNFGLRFNGDYGYYGLPEGVDGNWTLLGGVANIVYHFNTESGFKPYVLGGLGYYNAKVDITGFGSEDTSELAFNFGAGYDFSLGNANLFAEVRYLSIQTEGSALNTLPIMIGLRF